MVLKFKKIMFFKIKTVKYKLFANFLKLITILNKKVFRIMRPKFKTIHNFLWITTLF